ncbi:Pyridoxamine 5'-phosphate oxidase [Marivirga sericea]|uniref:Pyridoxamine 5'-phosphate oxidase n=1 Tax=Marivirga sericea TaxID=1028 RepID=A0A1X7II70_9BACT|nr:pyridoxamine 5'-phosphate oxidase family protein [Marivirga sericea]SMG14446.1 Pyridoxamine 5'-phosphate oxidase [Marivirga sericea]
MSVINSTDSLEEIKSNVIQLLNRAGNDRRSAFRFIILNTVANDYPNSRYVVLRKFERESAELFIYTDFRSNKIQEIRNNPSVSVLAYDKQKKFQIKLGARAVIHHQDELAYQHWSALDGGKESYNTSADPGKQVDTLQDAHQMKNAFDDRHFAVLVLKVSKMECLQLNNEGHIRSFFDLDHNQSSFLVP